MAFRSPLKYIVLCGSMLSMLAHSSVEIAINDTAYRYKNNPRLSEVLAPVAFLDSWYWPQSKLFRLNTKNAQALRSEVLNMLAQQKRSQNEHAALYENITQQLLSWEIADRVTVKIDFELSRISSAHNPRLDSAGFQLLLSKRPEHLYVFGALDNPQRIPYEDNTCIEQIMTQIKVSKIAHKSHLILISPQGNVSEAQTAYWNNECTLVMPVTMIYVPLQESLLSQQPNIINNKIAELAVNRIVAQ